MSSSFRGGYRSLAAFLAAMTVFFSCTDNVWAADSAYSDLIQEEITEEIILEEPLEEEALEEAEFEAVKRFKFSVSTDANSTLIESSLKNVEKVGSEYLIGEGDYSEYEAPDSVSFSVKVADDYLLDEAKTSVEVTSAGQKYTLYGADDLITFTNDTDSQLWTIEFFYSYADILNGGDLHFNIVTCSVASDYTLSYDGLSVYSIDSESSGLFYLASDKKYHILRDASVISGYFAVPVGKKIALAKDDEYELKAYFNGKEVNRDDIELTYYPVTGIVYLNYMLPSENSGKSILGDVKIAAKLENDSSQSSCVLSFSSNMNIATGADGSGLLRRKNATSYYIDTNNESGLFIDFEINPGYEIDLDSEGEPKITLNGKSWKADENASFSYYEDTLTLSYYFPINEKTEKTVFKNLSIAPTFVSKKTDYTFSVDSKSTQYMAMDPATVTSGENLISSGGKYFLRRGATEFTAKLKIASAYTDSFDTSLVNVSYGGKALSDMDYSVSPDDPDMLTVQVNRKYYAKEEDEEPSLRNGNIVVSYKPLPVENNKSAYTLTVGTGLYIDVSDPDCLDGLEYDAKTGKCYVTKDATSISAFIALTEGYYYAIPEGGIVANVKFGDKKANEENYTITFDEQAGGFNFSYSFDYNQKTEKQTLGNVNLAVSLQSLIKVSLDYDDTQLLLSNDDSGVFFTAANNKAFYVKKGEDLSFTVYAMDGYRVSQVMKGKETVPVQDIDADEKGNIISGTYIIKNVTAAATVTAKAAALPGVKLTPIIDEDKASKNATVEILGANNTSGEYITKNEEVTIKVKPAKGRVVGNVAYGNDWVYQDLQPEADGSYIITRSEVIALTETGEPVDIMITTDEEPVNVYVSVNGSPYRNESIDGLLDFNFDNGAIYDRKIRGYKTAKYWYSGSVGNNALEMSIDPASTAVIIDSVKYKLGDSGKLSAVPKVKETTNAVTGRTTIEYKLDDAEVQKAKKGQKDIYIEIAATKKDPKKITFTSGKGVIFTRYNGNGEAGAELSGTVDVQYGSELKFLVSLEKNKSLTYEIKFVKLGSKELKPVKDEYGQYYSTGKVLDDKPAIVEAEVSGLDCIIIEKESESELFKDKAELTLTTEETASISVYAGGEIAETTDISLTNIAESTGFATVEKPGIIKIDGSAAVGVTKKITLSISCAGETRPRQVDITVVQKPTAMVVSGFKDGKAQQAIGSSMVYAVKLDSRYDYSGISVALKDNSVNAKVSLDLQAGTLTVDTFKGEAFAEENKDIAFEFISKKGKTVGSEFVVTPVKAVIGAPRVKITDSDDRSATISLALPSGAENLRNLKYEIVATAITSKRTPAFPEGMKDTFTLSVSAEKTSVVIKFTENRLGGPMKYTISVKLVQYNGKEAYAEGKEFSVKATTKVPRYEKKLSLAKKQNAFTIYEKNVVLATARFSKATTYKKLVKAEIFAKGSNEIAASSEDGRISLVNNEVVIKNTEFFTPGKYILKVYPAAAEGTGKPATLNIVAKAPVTRINLAPGSGRLYKKDKKAASLKLTAGCISSKASNGKPSSSKLSWSVTAENEALLKAVKVKNGKVTVDKSYVLTGDKAKDSFTVTATATDLDASNEKLASSKLTILVTSEMIKPAAVSITGIDSLKAPVALGTVNGSKLVVTDSDGRAMDLSLVTITVAPKAGLTVTADGIIRVTRKGTYTITVTANDGSKNKIKQKIKIN